jgi:hypothetical protein
MPQGIQIMADIVTSPKKHTAPAINSFDDGFWNTQGRHVMKRDGAEDSSRKSKTSNPVEKRGMPTRKVLIKGGNKGQTVINRNPSGGQGESEISLRKGGHGGTEDVSKLLGSVRRDGNREESDFIVVGGQTSSLLEELKDVLSLGDSISRTIEEN